MQYDLRAGLPLPAFIALSLYTQRHTWHVELEAVHCFQSDLQVNMQVECDFVKDTLRGDELNEIRLKLISEGTEHYPFKDDD